MSDPTKPETNLDKAMAAADLAVQVTPALVQLLTVLGGLVAHAHEQLRDAHAQMKQDHN